MKNRKFKIKKLVATGLIASMILSVLSGCDKSNKQVENTEATTVATSTATEATSTEAAVEETTESVTFVDGDLDIDNDASIEHEVNSNFNKYEESYVSMGIDKDALRNVVLVLNDKYTDSEGNVIISEEDAKKAYSDIKKMLGINGSQFIQKIDNINSIEFADKLEEDFEGTLLSVGYDSETISYIDRDQFISDSRSVADEISASNDWEILEYPSFDNLVDQDKAGGKVLVEKLNEYKSLIDDESNMMNSQNKFDKERINSFVKDMEITDYNASEDAMNSLEGNGQLFTLAALKNGALQFAAKMNYTETYLPGYDSIEENIKINATNEEIFLENDILTLEEQGKLDSDVLDSSVTYIIRQEGLGYTVEEEEILDKYAVDSDTARIMLSYAHYLTTMAYYKYEADMCTQFDKTVKKIRELNGTETSRLDSNPTKKTAKNIKVYTYTQC